MLLVLLVGGMLSGSLYAVEALILLGVGVVVIGLAFALVAGRTRTSAVPLLTDPGVGGRELVYSRLGVEHGPVTAMELAQLAAAQGLPPTTQVRDTAGGSWFALSELVSTTSRRSFGATLALTFFLGALGAHWFYLGRPGLGALRLLTWGGTLALTIAAISEASNTSYDIYTGYYSGGPDTGLLVALYLAGGVIAMWTLLDLILVATRSVRDGDGRKLG